MKALVIGAGAGTSTKDVENGVIEGLRANGVETARYALDHRLATSDAYLGWVYKKSKRVPNVTAPLPIDVQLHALNDVLPRALAHGVDWVVLVSGMFVPLAFCDVLQRAGLAVAMVMTESPYDQEQELKWATFADLVWTMERSSVGPFRDVQAHTSYLRHAVRTDIHRPSPEAIDATTRAHDVVFVGSCFDERLELLEAVDWTGIDLGLYGNWQRVPKGSPIKRFVRSSVIDNRQAAALYRKAKIGLNLYRSSKGWAPGAARIDYAESLNPRAYELAACGCFSVSQARAETTEVFGAAVPTFTDAQSCEAQIRRWLHDDVGRASARARLPMLVSGQTWAIRGAQLAAELHAAQPSALARVARSVAVRQATVSEAVA